MCVRVWINACVNANIYVHINMCKWGWMRGYMCIRTYVACVYVSPCICMRLFMDTREEKLDSGPKRQCSWKRIANTRSKSKWQALVTWKRRWKQAGSESSDGKVIRLLHFLIYFNYHGFRMWTFWLIWRRCYFSSYHYSSPYAFAVQRFILAWELFNCKLILYDNFKAVSILVKYNYNESIYMEESMDKQIRLLRQSSVDPLTPHASDRILTDTLSPLSWRDHLGSPS